MEYVERFIEKRFTEWKQSWHDSYILEVAGCRQVGKTTTVLHFARENYQNVVYVNCNIDEYLNILEKVDEYNVLGSIQDYCHKRNVGFSNNNSTVLILDEIQESKALYERLRVFNRCLRCDVIVTGSYLKKAQEYFQSAGDLLVIRMYPLSYEEFLNYFGLWEYYQKHSIEEIATCRLEDFNQVYELYTKLGGYPSVLNAYENGLPIEYAFETLDESFKSEFRVRTGNVADYDKIEEMFRVICTLLCREKKGNRRIVEQVSRLTEQNSSKRISTKECNNLLAWMSAARIINYCDKIDLSSGESYSSERFFFEDIGFFSYLCKQYRIDERVVAGAVAENFIFKQLRENGDFKERFYGIRPSFAVQGDYEMDFCVQSKLDDSTYGIEVKSQKGKGVSAMQLLNNGAVDFIVYTKGASGFGQVGAVSTVPLPLFNKFTFDKGGIVDRKELPRIERGTFNMDLF